MSDQLKVPKVAEGRKEWIKSELHVAAWSGSIDRIMVLGHKEDLSCEDEDGQDALAYAEAAEQYAAIEALVSLGLKDRVAVRVTEVPTKEVDKAEGRLWRFESTDSVVLCEREARVGCSVRELRNEVQEQLGYRVEMRNPNGYEMGLGDMDMSVDECMKALEVSEQRRDPHNGKPYTLKQFMKCYGCRGGREYWELARGLDGVALRADSNDSRMYSKQQFIEFYGEEWGLWAWRRARKTENSGELVDLELSSVVEAHEDGRDTANASRKPMKRETVCSATGAEERAERRGREEWSNRDQSKGTARDEKIETNDEGEDTHSTKRQRRSESKEMKTDEAYARE